MQLLGFKFNGYLVVLFLLLMFLISGSTSCGCLKCGVKEAFGAVISKDYESVTDFDPKNFEKTKPTHNITQSPSPDDAMFYWGKNEFKKDCCLDNNSNYYNRDGCVCAGAEQIKFLSSRGGNATSPSN